MNSREQNEWQLRQIFWTIGLSLLLLGGYKVYQKGQPKPVNVQEGRR